MNLGGWYHQSPRHQTPGGTLIGIGQVEHQLSTNPHTLTHLHQVAFISFVFAGSIVIEIMEARILDEGRFDSTNNLDLGIRARTVEELWLALDWLELLPPLDVSASKAVYDSLVWCFFVGRDIDPGYQVLVRAGYQGNEERLSLIRSAYEQMFEESQRPAGTERQVPCGRPKCQKGKGIPRTAAPVTYVVPSYHDELTAMYAVQHLWRALDWLESCPTPRGKNIKRALRSVYDSLVWCFLLGWDANSADCPPFKFGKDFAVHTRSMSQRYVCHCSDHRLSRICHAYRKLFQEWESAEGKRRKRQGQRRHTPKGE